MYIYGMWPWKVPKSPWFWAEVAVKAWQDLATLVVLRILMRMPLFDFILQYNIIFLPLTGTASYSLYNFKFVVIEIISQLILELLPFEGFSASFDLTGLNPRK
jgi:hypothetical protein